MNSTTRIGKAVGRALRAQVPPPFRNFARAVDKRTVHQRSRDFYRSSGATWTCSLD